MVGQSCRSAHCFFKMEWELKWGIDLGGAAGLIWAARQRQPYHFLVGRCCGIALNSFLCGSFRAKGEVEELIWAARPGLIWAAQQRPPYRVDLGGAAAPPYHFLVGRCCGIALNSFLCGSFRAKGEVEELISGQHGQG